MSQVEAANSLRTWEFGGYAHYSEWPKVADAVIEALSSVSFFESSSLNFFHHRNTALKINTYLPYYPPNYVQSSVFIKIAGSPLRAIGFSRVPWIVRYSSPYTLFHSRTLPTILFGILN